MASAWQHSSDTGVLKAHDANSIDQVEGTMDGNELLERARLRLKALSHVSVDECRDKALEGGDSEGHADSEEDIANVLVQMKEMSGNESGTRRQESFDSCCDLSRMHERNGDKHSSIPSFSGQIAEEGVGRGNVIRLEQQRVLDVRKIVSPTCMGQDSPRNRTSDHSLKYRPLADDEEVGSSDDDDDDGDYSKDNGCVNRKVCLNHDKNARNQMGGVTASSSSSEGIESDSDSSSSVSGNVKTQTHSGLHGTCVSSMDQMLQSLPLDEERNFVAQGERADDAMDAKSVRSYGAALLALAENSRATRMQKKFSTGYEREFSPTSCSTTGISQTTPQNSSGTTKSSLKRSVLSQRRASIGCNREPYNIITPSFMTQPQANLRMPSLSAEEDVTPRSSRLQRRASGEYGIGEYPTTSVPCPPPEEVAKILSPGLVHKVMHRTAAEAAEYAAMSGAESYSFSSPSRQLDKKGVSKEDSVDKANHPQENPRNGEDTETTQKSLPLLPKSSTWIQDGGNNAWRRAQGLYVRTSGRLLGAAKQWWTQNNLCDELEPAHKIEKQDIAKGTNMGDCGTTRVTSISTAKNNEMIYDVKIEPERQSRIRYRVPYLLTVKMMRELVTHHLPSTVKSSQWKRLYSLARDGDSFETFLRLVDNHEHTLIVARTTREETLGGFVGNPWEHSQRDNALPYHSFYGSDNAFLFKVTKEKNAEEKLVVYKCTGSNKCFQMCDYSSKMIAMGSGVRARSYGLCLEDDFNIGSSVPCETYSNDSLASQDKFDVLDLEIWGFSSVFNSGSRT